MLVLPELLNEKRLFLRFNSAPIPSNPKSPDDFKASVLNNGTSIALHLTRIVELGQRCVQEFGLYRDQLEIKDDLVVFSSRTLGLLLHEIPSVLARLRVLQNNLLRFAALTEKAKGQLPGSIHDFIKKPDKYGLSPEAVRIIVNYWRSSGHYIKYLRDVDQHYYPSSPVLNRYFMQVRPKLRVHVQFPDYDEAGIAGDLKYDLENDALQTLHVGFTELHQAFEDLAALHTDNETQHQPSIRMDQLGDLAPFRERTLSLLYEESIQKTDAATTIHLSAVVIGQLESGQVSVRKAILDEEGLRRARALYGVRDDPETPLEDAANAQ